MRFYQVVPFKFHDVVLVNCVRMMAYNPAPIVAVPYSTELVALPCWLER